MSNTASPSKSEIGVRLYIWNKVNAEAALAQLLSQKDEIEEEVGEPLDWAPNPDARDKTIKTTLSADLRSREKWPEYLDWMVGRTAKFITAFSPRIKTLDLDVAQSLGEDQTHEPR